MSKVKCPECQWTIGSLIDPGPGQIYQHICPNCRHVWLEAPATRAPEILTALPTDPGVTPLPTPQPPKAPPMSSPTPKSFSPDQWSALLSSTIDTITTLAKLKGGEYSGDQDRLANFRRNAQALDLLPEQVWGVYAAKHWDAIMQYIKDLGASTKRKRLEGLSGRADDLIVYLLLFKAMLEERGED